MICNRCGSPVEDSASRFCPYCGASLPGEQAESPSEPPAEPAAPGKARCAVHPEAEAVEVCTRCGAFACAQCASANAKGEKLCASCAARFLTWDVPWERRGELGLFRAYWQTSKDVIFRPAESFAGLQPEGRSWWDPLSYAIVSTLLAVSGLGVFYAFIFGMGAVGAMFGGGAEKMAEAGGVMAGIAVGMVVALLIGGVLGAVLGVFLLGGLEHLMLMLVGARPGEFQATARAFCYAHAPMIFGLVPVCGAYVFPIYQIVCRIFGYKGVHRTTGGKAAAAVLLPMGLCCAGYVGLYAIFFGIGMASGSFGH